MKMAALIAGKFNIDPIIILKSGFLDWAIRVASYRYLTEREEQAARRQQAQANSMKSRRYS